MEKVELEKSTMLKAIKGYLNKYSGNIKFNGKLKEEEIMEKLFICHNKKYYLLKR